MNIITIHDEDSGDAWEEKDFYDRLCDDDDVPCVKRDYFELENSGDNNKGIDVLEDDREGFHDNESSGVENDSKNGTTKHSNKEKRIECKEGLEGLNRPDPFDEIAMPSSKKGKFSRLASNGDIPCPICDKAFGSITEYRQHKIDVCSSLEKNEIKCPYKDCSFLAADIKNYRNALNIMCNHIRAKHTREAVFQCEECSKKCYSYSTLSNHMQNHNDPRKYFCRECDHFVLKTKTAKHEEKHTSSTFTCIVCDKSFVTKGSLYNHKLLHKEPKYHCTKCDKTFHQKRNLELHMERKHRSQ